MKNAYFTETTVEEQAQNLQNKIKKRNSPKNLNWKNTALLVLDMQKYFLQEHSHAFVPSSKGIISSILELIKAFEEKGQPIIFTKHINNRNNAGNMATWWKDQITIDNPLSEIDSQFDTTNKIVIQKSQYDAFYRTNLDNILKSKSITDSVITGVMTHLCCETTARSAFVRGYQVWFPIDGTATYNIDFHLSTLRNLGHGFANIVLVEDILTTIHQKEIKES